MHRRAGFASSGLFAALLALVLTALSPVALATSSASPSPAAAAAAPKGVPIVLGVIPDPTGQRTKWSGDLINVNLDLNGAVLDAGASTVTVNGEQITLSTPASLVYLAPANPTLQMLWNDPKFAKGEFTFEISLVSEKGAPLQIYDAANNKVVDKYSWTFKSAGEASGGSLINFDVMKTWFW